MLYLILSRYWYGTFFQTYSATSRFNPHWEMDKTFSPSYSPSQITYVEAEAVGFSCFRFHRKRTASTASSFRFHIPGSDSTRNGVARSLENFSRTFFSIRLCQWREDVWWCTGRLIDCTPRNKF